MLHVILCLTGECLENFLSFYVTLPNYISYKVEMMNGDFTNKRGMLSHQTGGDLWWEHHQPDVHFIQHQKPSSAFSWRMCGKLQVLSVNPVIPRHGTLSHGLGEKDMESRAHPGRRAWVLTCLNMLKNFWSRRKRGRASEILRETCQKHDSIVS